MARLPHAVSSISSFDKLILLCLFSLALCAMFPPIRALSDFNSIWFVNAILVLLMLTVKNLVKLNRVKIWSFIAVVTVAAILLVALLSGETWLVGRMLELCLLFIFFLVFQHYFEKRQLDFVMVVTFTSFPFLVFTLIKTLISLESNPMVARLAKKDTSEGLVLMADAISGYDLAYAAPLIVLGLLGSIHLAVIQRKYLVATLFSVITILVVGFILNAGFTTSILITLVCTIIFLVLRMFGWAGLVSLVVFGIFILPILPDLVLLGFDVLVTLVDSPSVVQRVLELEQLIIASSYGISLEARMNAYSQSLFVILDFPVGGLLFSGEHESSLDKLGQHSSILDNFALLGLFVGGILNLSLIYPFIWLIRKSTNRKAKAYAVSGLIAFFFIGLANNWTPSTGLYAYFFLFPIVSLIDQLDGAVHA